MSPSTAAVPRGDDEVPAAWFDRVLLDWAMVARGPAAIDLAQALYVMGPEEDRAALLTSYLDALAEQGVVASRSAMEADLVAAVVVLFVTWTCAIARWEPATEREARIIDVGIARAVRAVHLLEDEITRFDEGA